MTAPVVLLYCTAPTLAEAERLAETIVGQRLAACANIIPGMRSLYWWQGKLERSDEVVMILKTRHDLVGAVTAALKAAHSYTVPCVLPIAVADGGNTEYVAWLLGETSQ